MKNLNLLLTLVITLIFTSCAQERTSARSVADKINSSNANTKVTNTQGLYYFYKSQSAMTNLDCSNPYDFYAFNNTNLFALQSLLPQAFLCNGNLEEFIVAVEMNTQNTGGNLFILFIPNTKGNININNPDSYIQYGTSQELYKWGLAISFEIYNAGGTQSFNSFGNFNAELKDNNNFTIGTLSMQTSNGGIGYSLLVGLSGSSTPFINEMYLTHTN